RTRSTSPATSRETARRPPTCPTPRRQTASPPPPSPGSEGQPPRAEATIPGSLSQLGAASIETIFSATWRDFLLVTNHGGLGDTVIGPRITVFSMPSSI